MQRELPNDLLLRFIVVMVKKLQATITNNDMVDMSNLGGVSQCVNGEMVVVQG